MSSRRSLWRRKLPTEPLCLEGEPGEYFQSAQGDRTRNDRNERKTRQLCEQVAEIIALSFADCDDPVLLDLHLEAVEPAPSASRLRVVVSGNEGSNAADILAALERARGYLRRQIADDIHRKRTPELCFSLAAPGAER